MGEAGTEPAVREGMRVVLMHNPSAGKEDHSADALIDEITRAGHQVAAHPTEEDELARALAEGCDLVVAAGGDGTFGRAAGVVAGTGLPLAIVPLGTANNIARVLGVAGSFAEQIAAWPDATIAGFDVGVARIDREERRFYEAIGFGAFPRVIHQTLGDEAEPSDRLTRDLRLLRARVARSPLERYTISADGEDLSGDYFLVEILNIPSIGPRVPLAPAADAGDGKLDVVLAGADDRALLLGALDRLALGDDVSIALGARQATQIAIQGGMRRYHCDGELHDGPVASFGATVDRHGLRVLVPSRRSGSRAS